MQTFAIQSIMPFQPSIILIFSNEMQPIYQISKHEVSMNLDCSLQAIDLKHGRSAVLRSRHVDFKTNYLTNVTR